MEQLLLNLGFENTVVTQQVVAILSPGSSPKKRIRDEAKDEKRLIDITHGRKTRALIITQSNHVILSAIQPEMKQRCLNLWFGNTVVAHQVVAILSPGSSPMKRVRDEAREEKHLIDITHGRKTRGIIITQSNHVILSTIRAKTVSHKFQSLLDEKKVQYHG